MKSCQAKLESKMWLDHNWRVTYAPLIGSIMRRLGVSDIAGINANIKQLGSRLQILEITREAGVKARAICSCTCGGTTSVVLSKVKTARTVSCGCLILETVRLAHSKNRKHGMSPASGRVPEYNIWAGIKQRCLNRNNKHFKDYGGRGITLCEEWMEFTGFFNDMGRRPTPKHSIDRINNDRGYCLENCRWATQKEQCRNTRKTILIKFNGESVPLVAAAESIGINEHTLYQRLFKHGWAIEDALSIPTQKPNDRTKDKRTHQYEPISLVSERNLLRNLRNRHSANG